MSLSLNGIVDYNKLESVFTELVTRLDAQSKRIDALEKELERRPSPDQYAAYQHALDERFTALEKRTKAAEQKVQIVCCCDRGGWGWDAALRRCSLLMWFGCGRSLSVGGTNR